MYFLAMATVYTTFSAPVNNPIVHFWGACGWTQGNGGNTATKKDYWEKRERGIYILSLIQDRDRPITTKFIVQ